MAFTHLAIFRRFLRNLQNQPGEVKAPTGLECLLWCSLKEIVLMASDRVSGSGSNEAPFFVVSPSKLVVMTLFTLGLYWWYCFYQSWRLHKVRTGEPVIPMLRSAFGMFYIYPLLKRVDDVTRSSGKEYPWSILKLTLSYYALMIAAFVGSFILEGLPWVALVVVIALQALSLYLLAVMQKGINFSAGDVTGKSNSKFSFANRFWMYLGFAMELSRIYVLFIGPASS
ncbi:hypothetical protein ACIPW4_08710 [Pseudomonas sp. NPDC089996]|uniref:hypothetical protein n=1 Tax=Pseudomonas sp. NPDC089996 TaxID=3364474 RepID=UPI0037FE75BB